MGNIERQTPPISWWIFRDLEGTALDVSDEEPVQETIQAPNGVWIGKVERPNLDTYLILKREFPKNRKYNPVADITYTLVGTIHRITKTEYETFQAFEEPNG